MVVLNNMDRFQLAIDAIRRVQEPGNAAELTIKLLHAKLAEHHDYIREHGEDMPEIRDWRWAEGP
jgi:xylulose-5-phosphate/fructose-6-phosphate phosphoketolase